MTNLVEESMMALVSPEPVDEVELLGRCFLVAVAEFVMAQHPQIDLKEAFNICLRLNIGQMAYDVDIVEVIRSNAFQQSMWPIAEVV